MNDITHVLLIRVVDLFIFSHGGNQNKQGGCVTLMWLAAVSDVILVLWCGCEKAKKHHYPASAPFHP